MSDDEVQFVQIGRWSILEQGIVAALSAVAAHRADVIR